MPEKVESDGPPACCPEMRDQSVELPCRNRGAVHQQDRSLIVLTLFNDVGQPRSERQVAAATVNPELIE